MNRLIVILFAFFTTSFSSFAQMVTTYEGKLGHTMAFNVASFTDVRDKTLEDVIKKMPGVAYDNLELSYNGMEVDKIYVNESDMRSSFMLVSGMKPEEIEKIEFIENYQAVKVLKGKQYSAITAMNVVLKNNSNASWSGRAKAGSGWKPTLYDADLYAIRLGEKSQNMFHFMANNSGQNLTNSISSFAADNIGLTVNYFALSNYIDITGSTTALSDNRTRFNDSYMFNTVNTFKLSDKYQLYTQASYLYDKNKSEMSTDMSYYLKDGTAVTINSGEYASRKTNQAKTNIALISNTDKYYLVNHIFANANWQDVGMELTGTYPNSQSGKLTSITAKDDFRYLRPIGDWNLTVFSQNQISSIPQNISIRREGSSQHQDIHSRALFSDTKVSFGYTANEWTVAMVGGFDALDRTLKTDLTGVNVLEVKNNDSDFGFLHAYIQPTANYVSPHLQMQLGLPVKYYHYWFDEHTNDETSKKGITNFEPSLSVKYQINRLLSFTLNGKVQYDQVDAGSFYTGMILTNYRNIKEGSLKYDLDNERSIALAYSYKLPEYSYFMNGNIGYQVGKSMYRTFDTFVGDYVLRGQLPQQTDTKERYADINISKGITSLKGTIGVWIGYTNTDRKMVRNDELVKFNTQVFAVTPTINGRISKWMKVDYKFNLWNTLMKITGTNTESHSDRYNQSLELILTPTNKINFSVLGEHYHTSISGEKAKNLFLADLKAEYQFAPRWQFIASITNLLNQTDYSYTLIDGLNSTHSSYKIRPRNVLLSLYYTF